MPSPSTRKAEITSSRNAGPPSALRFSSIATSIGSRLPVTTGAGPAPRASGSAGAWSRRQLVDAVEEQGAVDRFGQAGIHAGFLGPSGGSRRRIGRQADDGHATLACGSHPVELRGFEAVHDRHVEVHHDRVEGLRFQLVEGLLAVFRHDDLMASGLEDQTDHLLIDPVVVRHEDLQATLPAPDRRLTGRTRGITAPREDAMALLRSSTEPVIPQDGQDRASRDLTRRQAAARGGHQRTGRRDGRPRARAEL